MTENDTPRMQTRDIAEAVALLTRLPLTDTGTRGAKAAWAWPLAGALVALFAGVTGWVALWLGLPDAIAAAIVLAVMVILTGAMHEDGLADCADGFWGGWAVERRLEIMKDSRIGTYGVIALVLSLVIRWSALTALLSAHHVIGPLIAVAALSRAPMAALAWGLPSVRAGGLSDRTGQPERDTAILAAVVALLLALITAGFAALPVAVVIALAAWLVAGLAQAKIGGQTGDVLGTAQQVCEIAGLAVLAAILT